MHLRSSLLLLIGCLLPTVIVAAPGVVGEDDKKNNDDINSHNKKMSDLHKRCDDQNPIAPSPVPTTDSTTATASTTLSTATTTSTPPPSDPATPTTATSSTLTSMSTSTAMATPTLSCNTSVFSGKMFPYHLACKVEWVEWLLGNFTKNHPDPSAPFPIHTSDMNDHYGWKSYAGNATYCNFHVMNNGPDFNLTVFDVSTIIANVKNRQDWHHYTGYVGANTTTNCNDGKAGNATLHYAVIRKNETWPTWDPDQEIS